MNGPAPGRLSRRGGTGRKPGSLCRGPAGGAGSQGFRRPSPGLAGPAAGAHRPLRTPQSGRSFPLGSPPTPGTDPNPQPGSRRSPCTRPPKFGDSGGVTATSEPFPRRRRQVSGGPGGSRGQIPEAGLAAPSGGWREPAARGARARPRVTFGRSQVSPPVFAAAQPHGSRPRPPLGSAAWRAACCPHPRGGSTDVRPAGSVQPGAGPPAGQLPRPHAPYRSRSAGLPTSGQTLLINRRTRRSRRPRRPPAFISARRLPALAGALPAARYSPGAPSCALARGHQGALCEPPRSVAPSSISWQPAKGGGRCWPTADRKERSPRCARAAPPFPQHPLSSHLMVTWGASTRATLLSVFQLTCTPQLCSCPDYPPDLSGLPVD